HDEAPRVLIANSNLVGQWNNYTEFNRLERLGLTMYGQMTAGSWIYIGSQGIVQGTFETFAAAGRKHFGGSLEGKFVLTGGLGGMGGAQPLAATMNGAVFLGIEVDAARIEKRLKSGYCDKIARSLDEALKIIETARNVRLRQQHSRPGAESWYQERIRYSRLRSRIHSSAFLRRPRPLSLGRVERRAGRHRAHGQARARIISQKSNACALDETREREDPISRIARADLLARLRRACGVRCRHERARQTWRNQSADRDRPRSPRRWFSRIPESRNRRDERWQRRDRRLAVAQRAHQHGRRCVLDFNSQWRRCRHRLLATCRNGRGC